LTLAQETAQISLRFIEGKKKLAVDAWDRAARSLSMRGVVILRILLPIGQATSGSSSRSAGAIRIQYISVLLVAVLAGLGFDYAFEQLLKRSRERGEEIAHASP
jgi:hypothetical protein